MKTLKFQKFKNTPQLKETALAFFFQCTLYYSDILTKNFIFKYEIGQ